MDNKEIGLRIKTKREELKLTQDEIAKQIGVNKSTVQRYEKGLIKKIKLPVISSIANVLNVNPLWIVGKTSDPTPENKLKKVPSISEMPEALKLFLRDKLGREPTDDELSRVDNFFDMFVQKFEESEEN